jgi:hypothetical protein
MTKDASSNRARQAVYTKSASRQADIHCCEPGAAAGKPSTSMSPEPGNDRPKVPDRLMAIFHKEPDRAFPVWELCKRLWLNWRTEGGKVPAEASAIVRRVLDRLSRDGLVERHPSGWHRARPGKQVTVWYLKFSDSSFQFRDPFRPATHEGHCHLGAFKNQTGHMVFVASECEGSPGVSVTGAAEAICQAALVRFAVPFEKAVFIEHWPGGAEPKKGEGRKLEDTWERVLFASPGDRPTWAAMQEADWKALGLSIEQVKSSMGL